jgi:hypothetical protein
MKRHTGFALIDALVAMGLAALALGALALAAGVGTYGVRLARDSGTAIALAGARLEALRAGPRGDGTDVTPAPDGTATAFTRRWWVGGGRGTPAALAVEVTWGTRALVLATEAFP